VNSNKSILVTGAEGFLGRNIVQRLLDKEYHIIQSIKYKHLQKKKLSDVFFVIHLSQKIQLPPVSIDYVVHLAARAHILKETASNPLREYREVNTMGTLRLAEAAALHGVKRFIFLSSIGVNGNISNERPFSELDPPNPHNDYTQSKYEAEQGLLKIAKETGMKVVIIRPPLVYGPGVKANFLKMMKWVYRGIPLPLGAINNQRSLIALDNLADLIMLCIEHPAAANQIFLAADGEDVSITELLTKLAHFLGKPARLIPVPQNLLEATLNILGKRNLAIRLCGSLQVDINKARNLLGWNPPLSLDEGLNKTAKWFLQTKT